MIRSSPSSSARHWRHCLLLRFESYLTTVLTLTLLLLVPDGHARQLLEVDGIVLRGTARLVAQGAGTCQVLESHHPAEQYERMKVNHGQPLDVWQLDFSVHNGTGKRLDHLIARFTIAAEWPPCTTWDGPVGRYSEPVQWADTMGRIQRSGTPWVVAPNETLKTTRFILVFHDDQPRFRDWSVDYTFAAPSTQPPPPSPTSKPPPRSTGNTPSGSLILLIDVSGSMNGTKLRSAKNAAIETIRKAIGSNTEIAVLAFEGDCQQPIHASIGFTRKENELIAFVNGLSAVGGTPLATALEATNRFMNQHKSATSRTQMILLLADGDDDCGNLDPVLQGLKRNNLLYRHETVGLEVSGAAQRQLQHIATQSGGNYHHASSETLSKVFSDAVDLMKMLDMIGKFR